MKKRNLAVWLTTLALLVPSIHAQVTIGSDKEPIKGALLDLRNMEVTGSTGETATKGLMLPRVELISLDKLKMSEDSDELVGDEKNNHIGLTVYNVNDTFEKCDPTTIASGVYIWNGTKWNGMNTPKHADNYLPAADSPIFQPNSFIVPSDGATASATSITIPVAKAFAMWDFLASEISDKRLLPESFAGNLSTAVLWQEGVTSNDIVGTPTLSTTNLDQSAVITVPIVGNKGNAVITLSDGKDIRWSWHIWVTDDPRTSNLVHFTGTKTVEFLDRTLGAVSNQPENPGSAMSLHYFWGRKDPFPGHLDFDNDAKTRYTQEIKDKEAYIHEAKKEDGRGRNTTMRHILTNPFSVVSYRGSGGTRPSYDWYNDEDPSTWKSRWNEVYEDECGNTMAVKSPMDPCPEGWRIPLILEEDFSDSPWNHPTKILDNPYDLRTASSSHGFTFSDPEYNIGYCPHTSFRYNSFVGVSDITWIPNMGMRLGHKVWASGLVHPDSYFPSFIGGGAPNFEVRTSKWSPGDYGKPKMEHRVSDGDFALAVRCIKE